MIEVRDPLEKISATFPPGYFLSLEQPLAVESQRWAHEKASGSDVLDTSPEKIAEIKAHILATDPSPIFMEQYWPDLAERLKNPALAQLIQTPKKGQLLGDSSEFLPMLLCLFPYSMSLEMAFLRGLTTKLEFREITPEDPYYWTAIREKLYKFIRIRSAWSADIMAKIQPDSSLFLGCGRMFAKRYVDPTVYGHSYLVDTDTSILLSDLFPDEEVRSHYQLFHIRDDEFLTKVEAGSIDYVEMLGRAIYMFTEDDFSSLHSFFQLVYSRMKKGGHFVFDVNCAHPDWNKLLMPIAFTRGKINITFLKDNMTIVDRFFHEIFEDISFAKIRFEPIQLEDQDIGVLFSLTK